MKSFKLMMAGVLVIAPSLAQAGSMRCESVNTTFYEVKSEDISASAKAYAPRAGSDCASGEVALDITDSNTFTRQTKCVSVTNCASGVGAGMCVKRQNGKMTLHCYSSKFKFGIRRGP